MQPTEPSDAREAASDRTILIVDDDLSVTDGLRVLLEGAGYSIRSAASGAEAKALAESSAFCVAIVDLYLPDCRGTELATALKLQWPDAEVIFLTGYATVESAQAAVRAGAWAYLTKPCEPELILQTVHQAARQVALVGEARQLARRAMVAEKLLAGQTLTAGLSHEIRNPLNAATLQLAMLDRRLRRMAPDVTSQLNEPLASAQAELNRLAAVVNRFLEFSKPVNLIPERVDLTEVVDSVLAELAGEAAARQVQMERFVGASRFVRGDRQLLKQAVMQLVLNAIEATPAGGWVRLEATEQPSAVVLSIEDSGSGIPPALRSRLFEPFFTTKQKGSGLGLPKAQSIIQQHGGTLLFEEGGQGGARFVIKLPLNLAP